IALDEFFVLHHELLAAVGVHFGAECFGQMAPDVFIDVGDLVGLTCLTTTAATRVIGGLLGVLILLIALLLGLGALLLAALLGTSGFALGPLILHAALVLLLLAC